MESTMSAEKIEKILKSFNGTTYEYAFMHAKR